MSSIGAEPSGTFNAFMKKSYRIMSQRLSTKMREAGDILSIVLGNVQRPGSEVHGSEVGTRIVREENMWKLAAGAIYVMGVLAFGTGVRRS